MNNDLEFYDELRKQNFMPFGHGIIESANQATQLLINKDGDSIIITIDQMTNKVRFFREMKQPAEISQLENVGEQILTARYWIRTPTEGHSGYISQTSPNTRFSILHFFRVKSATELPDYDGDRVKTHSLKNLFSDITVDLDIRANDKEAATKLAKVNFREPIEIQFHISGNEIQLHSEDFPLELISRWTLSSEIYNQYGQAFIFSTKH